MHASPPHACRCRAGTVPPNTVQPIGCTVPGTIPQAPSSHAPPRAPAGTVPPIGGTIPAGTHQPACRCRAGTVPPRHHAAHRRHRSRRRSARRRSRWPRKVEPHRHQQAPFRIHGASLRPCDPGYFPVETAPKFRLRIRQEPFCPASFSSGARRRRESPPPVSGGHCTPARRPAHLPTSRLAGALDRRSPPGQRHRQVPS